MAVALLRPRVAVGITGVVPKAAVARRPPGEVGERVVIEEREVVVEERRSERARLESGHASGATPGLTATSGIASISKIFLRSSIGVREEMISRTFFRPFILPMRIAPTSLSLRKKRRL